MKFMNLKYLLLCTCNAANFVIIVPLKITEVTTIIEVQVRRV